MMPSVDERRDRAGRVESPRLRGLVTRSPVERCELCATPVTSQHRHLLALASRELRCVCRACAVLFERPAAGGGSRRLVPERCWYLPDLDMDDTAWQSVPVGLAFCFHDSTQERAVALYPSPAGATESAIGPRVWPDLMAGNPVLWDIEPDVEALLVNRARGAREQWLAPIDTCFALVGLVRMRWTGLSGGERLWAAIDDFFAELRRQARTVRADRTERRQEAT